MVPKTKKIITRGVATPTTYGTAFMRVALTLIIALSCAAIVLFVVALGIDQVYVLHNKHNIYAATGASTTTSSPVSRLLLPQFDVTVGLVTACVSHSCFARVGRRGVQNLISSTLGSEAIAGGTAADLQTQLESEFRFGYDSGVHCGGNESKLRRVAQFGYAAYAISLFFFVGVCVTSILFCLVVGDVDVLAGTPSLDKDSNAINVDNLGLPGTYLMLKLKRHLLHEDPLMVALLVLSGLAFVFSVCAMGITIAVDLTTTKCGTAVCTSFEQSMTEFFDELTRLKMAPSTPRTFSCRTGASFPLTIVGFVMGLLCLLLAGLMFAWQACSQRRRQMLSLRDQLFRLADVQGLIGTITGGETPFPMAQSRQVSGVASSGSAALSISGGFGGRDAAGNAIAYRRGNSTFSRGTTETRAAVFTAVESEERRARSVGARIGVYRALKQFMTTEEQARQGIVAQEKTEFFAFVGMRETLWYNEELCMLNEFALRYFVGPPLDLCVLETYERQAILSEYTTYEASFLRNVAAGFEAPEEPAQAWDRGSPLPPADVGKWAAQVGRWQTMQSQMAPAFLQTASYKQADPAPPPRTPKQRSKAPLTLAALPFSSLDTDHWITLLDKLRASYDDEPFLLRSASPLLVRRSTSAVARFEDDTSFSSNVFSDPSFAMTRCDDAVPTDNVRLHLVKAAYITKTGPQQRPPPRLRRLPPSADDADDHEGGDRRERRSSARGPSLRRRRSNGSSTSSGRPSGRSPASRAQSTAAASQNGDHIGGSFSNASLSNTAAPDGTGIGARVRPFSSRDGTSSGRSPFLTALATHNASVAPVTKSGNVSVNASSSMAPVPERGASPRPASHAGDATPQASSIPTGSSWRFQKPS